METKVLSAIMKMQAAQIMLSNEGITTELTTDCKKFGSITLNAFVHNSTEEIIACDILQSYKFAGSDLYSTTNDQNTEREFRVYTMTSYISGIK